MTLDDWLAAAEREGPEISNRCQAFAHALRKKGTDHWHLGAENAAGAPEAFVSVVLMCTQLTDAGWLRHDWQNATYWPAIPAKEMTQ